MSHNIRQPLRDFRMNKERFVLIVILLLAIAGWLYGGLAKHRQPAAGTTQVVAQPKQPALSTVQSKPQLDYVNQIRADHGLAPLKEDQRLDASAADKAADLIAENYFAHTSPQRGEFYTFIYKQISVRKAGENLGECYPTGEAAFAAFVGSPEHYVNIVDPAFNIFGSALVYQPNDHCLLWVDHFGEL